MLTGQMVAVIIIWAAILLLFIVVGRELFAIMVDERLRYLRLITFYAHLSERVDIPRDPGPVARYISWALGENRQPVACAHIRHAGRIRYGNTGRWMTMGGEGYFSLAVPGFVWHSTISYVPGIWLDAFDYYVDREAGMNINLFSLVPLNNAHTDEIKDGSLFRYLAWSPLFPMIYDSSGFITWENIDDLTAKVIIRDKEHLIEAIARFDDRGWIDSIDSCRKTHPETGRPLPGHFASRFSGYTNVNGYHVPLQISSDLILPDGEYACAEFTITSIVFDETNAICRRNT
ncbi:MAG: hypothetical protein M0Q92_08375 [Methanoregula sp.]|jgi:hypothetical protein|nr:hypothetical protein [Methanoregula sp.]